MADDYHQWRLGQPHPLLRSHSAAKHRVIASYLGRYVDVLTANPRIPQLNLTLVDGFAGGGLYRDFRTKEERFGSPLLMLQAMRNATVRAQLKRSGDFVLDVEYFFIESSPETFPCLKANLEASEFRPLLADRVRLINDQFADHVQPIVIHLRKRSKRSRAIFVLDQCGYSNVPFSAIQVILGKLENAEVILTFAVDSLIDYLSGQPAMQQTLERVGLQLDADRVQAAKQELDWRRIIQYLLHHEIFEKSGAKYYTPFFIWSKDAHRAYWLVHLSNHSRAHDVMAELHWREQTTFAHYGRPGLLMLGYDQDADLKITGQAVFPEFGFDDAARVSTEDCLLSELPERIFAFKDGISFANLFSNLTNETPATSEIIKGVLARLNAEEYVEIRDKTGLIRRRAGVQHASDILMPPAQRQLFYPGMERS